MNKKGFTLVELIAVIGLIAIIAAFSFRIITKRIQVSKERLYKSLMSDLQKATEKYMLQHDDSDIYHLNTLCIKITLLQSEGHLEKGKIVNPKDGRELTGFMKVSFDDTKKQYQYEYTENCTPSTVVPFAETILENNDVKVINSGAGLYESTDKYIFKGDDPNNNVKINGNIWKIVSIDKTTNEVKIVNLKDNPQQWPESGLKEYLNNDYEEGTTYDTFKDNISVNTKWNIGKITKLDSSLSINSLEKQSNDFYTIGLLSVGEYIDSSINKDCYQTNNCSSYLTTSKKFWLINNYDDNNKWYVDNTNLKYANTSDNGIRHIYPALYLKANTTVSGTGTEVDPYIIK